VSEYRLNSRQVRGEPREYWVERWGRSKWVAVSKPLTRAKALRILADLTEGDRPPQQNHDGATRSGGEG
jgi:hypothetical protein